jgi:hypothetical protein
VNNQLSQLVAPYQMDPRGLAASSLRDGNLEMVESQTVGYLTSTLVQRLNGALLDDISKAIQLNVELGDDKRDQQQ